MSLVKQLRDLLTPSTPLHATVVRITEDEVILSAADGTHTLPRNDATNYQPGDRCILTADGRLAGIVRGKVRKYVV